MRRFFVQEENGITEGVIWKQLLIFFFPILFGTFFQQLYNTVDAVIVGRFVGTEALAAVGGSTSVLINLLVNLFVGISSGTTVVVAQHFGAQNHEAVSQAVHTSFALAIVGGAGLTVLGIAIAPAALGAMGTPADTLEGSLTYIRVYFLGIIASFIYNVGSGILRAVGDTKRPLYFLIVACLCNIVLDVVFVVFLRLGVLGVAIATLISQIVSAVLVVFALLTSTQSFHLFIKQIRFTGPVLRHVLSVGLPAGIQSDMYAISNILIQFCINSFGTSTVAAWAAFGKVDSLYWMISGAFGISITTFVGQNFGARKYDRIKRSVRVCLGMSFGTTALMSVLMCLLSRFLLMMFTADSEVLRIGMEIMWIQVPFYFTYVCIEVLSGAIRGTGDSLIPMLMTCTGICVMRVVWIFCVLPFRRELSTVVASYPITWAITSLLFIAYYLQGGWLRRRIAKQGPAHE
ncbi:MAG: MATE family efflux transporter [Clostridiales bacterium]|uniref:MATE family efflux protein n=1 Tax=Harryflintia acetispora TaxID=1849041 RepID=A0A9X8Y923_9FIRM|nr:MULTISPECIES: MATE family efflux transporter [Oscillospiraceae]PWM36742.1 MAG: MATE family efflux transporter [Clostridiales bacterium]TCL45038.1 putative MATE family efflux protein [Harryflintia acetispora]